MKNVKWFLLSLFLFSICFYCCKSESEDDQTLKSSLVKESLVSVFSSRLEPIDHDQPLGTLAYLHLRDGQVIDTINPTKYKEYVQRVFTDVLNNLTEEQLIGLIVENSANKSYFMADFDPISRVQGNTNLGNIPPLRSLDGKTTNYVVGFWDEIHKSIDDLINSGKGWNVKDKYGFALTPFKVDAKNGEKLRAKFEADTTLNTEYNAVKAKCKIWNSNNDCDNAKIVEYYYKDRLTVMIQITYDGSRIKTDTYNRTGSTAKIATLFNVGRLCPPKCSSEI